MPIDGLYAADEETVDDTDSSDERDTNEPLRTDHDWDEPETAPPPQTRNTYDNIPYTD